MKTVCDRDWPEDFEHENGNYMNTCCECKNTFTGHKRRFICKACSTSQGGEAVEVVAVAFITRAEKSGPKIAITLKKEDAERQHKNWLSMSKIVTTEPLMTVAQHNRIMAAATHPADQVAEGVGVPLIKAAIKYIDSQVFYKFGEPVTKADREGRRIADELRQLLAKSEWVKP